MHSTLPTREVIYSYVISPSPSLLPRTLLAGLPPPGLLPKCSGARVDVVVSLNPPVVSGVRWRPWLPPPPEWGGGRNASGVESVVPCGWTSCTSFTRLKFSSTATSSTLGRRWRIKYYVYMHAYRNFLFFIAVPVQLHSPILCAADPRNEERLEADGPPEQVQIRQQQRTVLDVHAMSSAALWSRATGRGRIRLLFGR